MTTVLAHWSDESLANMLVVWQRRQTTATTNTVTRRHIDGMITAIQAEINKRATAQEEPTT